jgi:thioredoxin reductase
MESKEQIEKHLQILVIGAGPAGVQMGYFLKKEKIDYLILEKGDKTCQFFRTYPRHRKLISINKKYNVGNEKLAMRYDWNSLLSEENKPLFTDITDEYFPNAQLLAEYVEDFANYHEINIKHNSGVEHISKNEQGIFKVKVKDSNITYYAPIVVTASGFGEPFRPNIKGIEFVDDYADTTIEGDYYKNKKVAIIGKGNSAFEFAKGIFNYADTIILISPNPLREASQTHYVGSVRATNNLSFEAYQLKSKNFLMNSEIRLIEKNKENPNKFNIYFPFTDEEKYEEAHVVDHVINATGFKMTTSFYDESIKPKMRNCTKLPVLDHTFQSVNVENLYVIGCLMHGCDYKRGTSGFVHGFRHNIKFLYRHLMEKHFDRPLAYTKCKNVDEMCDIFQEESLHSQELFLQIRTLCDVAVIRKNEIMYYKGILQDYVKHEDFKKEQDDIVIIMYLDYGKFFENTTNHPRPAKIEEGYTSSYLHPQYFVYKYDNKKLNLVSKFEIIEEIDNNFALSPRDKRQRDHLKTSIEKIETIRNLENQECIVKVEIDSKKLDAEILMNKIIGPYRTIDPKKDKNMNFMKLLPFEYVCDCLVFKQSAYNAGYTFDAKTKFDDEMWSIRINTACDKSGIVKVEIWPHKGNQITLLPIELEFTFPKTNSDILLAKIMYSSDLNDDLKKALEEGLINKTESLFE